MKNLRKIDNGEFNNLLTENKTYQEYKPFSAEEYYCEEKYKEPREIIKINELSFVNEDSDGNPENKKQTDSTTNDNNQHLKKEIQKRLPSTQATSSINTSASTATSASTVVSVSSIATAAVVFIVASTIIFANLGKYINITSYMDCILMDIDLVGIIEEDKVYQINQDNFFLDVMVDDSSITIDLKYGKYTYFVGGLDPNTTYEYTISYIDNVTSEKVVCYKDIVSTTSNSSPTAIYDELNSFIVYNEQDDNLLANYTIYVSDYNKKYDYYQFVMCSSIQSDYNELTDVIYFDETSNDNYFNSTQILSKYNNIYYYVFGIKGDNKDLLLYKDFTFAFELPAFKHDLSSYVNVTTYNDCFLIDIDLSNIISLDEDYQINQDNFILDVVRDYLVNKINLSVDHLTYLISGLEPNTTYEYSISYNDSVTNKTVLCYQGEVNTNSYSDPIAIYDEFYSSIVYNDVEDKLVSTYFIYISDYQNYYDNYQLVISSSVQNDFNDLRNIIYQDNQVTNVPFSLQVSHTKYNNIYYYVFGIKGDEKDLLLYKDFSFNFDIPMFEPDMTNVNCTDLPGSVIIDGGLINFVPSYEYIVSVNQYDENNNVLYEGEASLNVSEDSLFYSISFDTYYGLNNYKYFIYTISSNYELSCIYESERFTYTSDQNNYGNLTIVNPDDAEILYYNDHLQIVVDPNFESSYDNYYYVLIAKNSQNEVYGVYEGRDRATIDIYDLSIIDTLNFEYIECGTFIDYVKEYSTHELNGSVIDLPQFGLEEQINFINDYFELSYYCNMNYDYSKAYLEITIDNGTSQVSKVVENIASSGTIALDFIEGEIPNANITCALSFKDNQTNNITHTLINETMNLDLLYRFDITRVQADYSAYGMTTVPVEIQFNYDIPSNYKISISDSQSTINETIDLCNEFYFDTLPLIDDNIELIIQVLDNNGNLWNGPYIYNINHLESETIYKEASIQMYCSNPGDSLVTYNDDGTINLYRLINFSSDNENIYYNAFIYTSEDVDPINGRTIYNNSHNSIGRDKYSIIENIPDQLYIFHYYTLLDYNDVSYVMYMEYPSGSISSENFEAYATVTQSSDTPSTTINLTIGSYGYLDNRIIYNNNDVAFTFYENPTDSSFYLTINENVEVTEITIFFSEFVAKYDEMKNEIEIKGNLYRPYTIEVIVGEL